LQGVFSDLFVVKGIEIGHEIVSVHLLEPQLQNMADELLLTVAEAMSLASLTSFCPCWCSRSLHP